jgi:hypothetical protein
MKESALPRIFLIPLKYRLIVILARALLFHEQARSERGRNMARLINWTAQATKLDFAAAASILALAFLNLAVLSEMIVNRAEAHPAPLCLMELA